MSGDYIMQLAFDSDDPEFARGFEAGLVYGLIYESVQSSHLVGSVNVTRPIHANNAEMAMRIAERFDCEFSAEDLDDNFVQVTFVTRDPS